MDRNFKWIGILNDLFYGRSHIAGPGELSIPLLLDEKPDVVPGGSAERPGGARKVLTSRQSISSAPLSLALAITVSTPPNLSLHRDSIARATRRGCSDFATDLPELFAAICSKRKLSEGEATSDAWIYSVDDCG